VPAPSHPALRKETNYPWRDVHHANDPKKTTRYRVVPTASGAEARLNQVGGAIRSLLEHAFETEQVLRVQGGRWSLSDIGRPESLLLDLGNYVTAGVAWEAWKSSDYAADAESRDVTPVLLAGSLAISSINEYLRKKGLALQTSGASDGQTLAGALATGTHGADLKVGAIHDTVKAIHLIVAPDQAYLIQPKSAPFTEALSATLSSWFGIPCELKSDDQLFRAALVHLGSLGIVLNYIVETAPLYYLSRWTTPHHDRDLRWRAVLSSRHPRALDPGHALEPDYLQFVINPYLPLPERHPRAWVMSMTKKLYSGQADVDTDPDASNFNSDLTGLIPALVEIFEQDLELPGNPVLRTVMTAQMRDLYTDEEGATKALPGAMFGPPGFLGSNFDPARGASAEYVFNATQARAAVATILSTLEAQAAANNQFMGAIGVRFVKGSQALLALNTKSLNCFAELQGLYTDEFELIQTAIGKALESASIPHAGHWGQWRLNTPTIVKRWWGAKADAWVTARERLLPSAVARKVFASPILAPAGLG